MHKPEFVGRKPDFIGIGTMKAGTSWWYYLLSQHPEINLGNPEEVGAMKGHADLFRIKERHFWDQYHAAHPPKEAIDAYFRSFPVTGNVVGEWTVCYQYYWWVPGLIKQHLPDVKLLTILRNPIDRYVEGINFIAADQRLLAGDQFYRGFYARQLENVYQHISAKQVLVLQYEKLVREPEAEIARTFSFLGVDPSFVPEGLRRRVNDQDIAKELPPEYRALAAAAFRADVNYLFALLGHFDRSLWPDFA
jgi:hypothetical protein